ncbi:tail fiber domain-containing protein [Bdellovibrio sp. HCB-110]|uniref:tail fiber domain-containing protein n=1 Tax=Bdellovibrio sp. HCB-110 TaxID=3391182 RepID=UPI0039B3D724
MMKPSRLLENSSGIGLIEVLVVVGIVSIIASGMTSLLVGTVKGQRSIQAKDQQREVMGEIRSILTDKAACANTFTGNNPSSTFTVSQIRDGANANRFVVGGTDSSNRLQFTEFRVDSWRADPANSQQGIADLHVVLDKTGDIQGVRNISQNINLRIRTDASGGILECFALGGAFEFWQPSPVNPNNIFFGGGWVGIGGNSPRAALDVVGATRLRAGAPINDVAEVGLAFEDNGDTGLFMTNYSSPSTGDLNLYTNAVPRMTVLSNGNIGVGTTTPSYRMHIAGGQLVVADTGSAAIPSIGIGDNNTGLFRLGAGAGIGISANGAERMRVDASGNVGIGTAAPGAMLDVAGEIQGQAFYYSSDKRLKKNFRVIEDPLQKIQKMNGYSFEWKSTGRRDIGFAAQEVEEIFPELVGENPNTHLKSVEYGNMTAVLVEATKVLVKQVESQKHELEELRKEVARLKKEKSKK